MGCGLVGRAFDLCHAVGTGGDERGLLVDGLLDGCGLAYRTEAGEVEFDFRHALLS